MPLGFSANTVEARTGCLPEEQEREELAEYVRRLTRPLSPDEVFNHIEEPASKMSRQSPERSEEQPAEEEEENAIVTWIKESNIAKAKKVMECLEKNDRQALRGQLIAPEVEWTNRRGGQREGIDAMFGKLGGLQAIFPDTTYEVSNFVAVGATMVEFDNIMRIEPGGRVFRNRSVLTFDDGGRIIKIDNSKPLDKDAEGQLGTGAKLFPALVPVVDGKAQVY